MKRFLLGAGVLGLMSSFSACGSDDVATDQGTDEAHAYGDVALGLMLADGSSVSTVQYVVTRAGAQVRSGDMTVGADGRANVTISGLDSGTGYHVKLSAARGAAPDCIGEADFTVVEGQTTNVNVILQCSDASGAEGNVTLNGTFNVCPKPGSITASPVTVAVGASSALTFSASDRDGDALSYTWTATDGSFSTPNAANTSYTCASAGAKTLTMTVTDGPSRGCTKTAAIMITCASPGSDLDGGLGQVDGSVDGGVANIQILAFNDFHGNIEPPTGSNGNVVPGRAADGGVLPSVTAGGAGFFARHVANLKAQNPNNTIVVSAGDLIGASPLASALFHDEPTIQAMNQLGLDINGVGNHEFDDGRLELLRMQNGGCPAEGCGDGGTPFPGAKFQFLSANVKTESGATLFPRYTIKSVDGVKIAFIGMTLEGTPGIVSPAGIQGLTFYDEADTVNMLVPELQGQGVKAIVVVIHEGGFQSGLLNECLGISGAIVDIVNRLDPEVDLVVSGHTHASYNCLINNRRVTSALAFGRLVTQIKMGVDRTTQQVVSLSAENKIATRDVAEVPEVKAIVDDAVTRVTPLANRVLGTASGLLTRTNNAAGESPLGDIIADAQRADTFVLGSALPQLALMNPGGVRADIQAGPIKYVDAFTTQPFGNGTVAMTLTGAQLKTALEQQFAGFMGQTTTRILYVSANVAYTWSASAALGSKISNLSVDGVPVDPSKGYRVTVNSFLSTGGDGFTTFNAGTDRVGGNVDIDALANYLQANDPIAPPPSTRVTRVP